jgi:uncharacterized membrane protein
MLAVRSMSSLRVTPPGRWAVVAALAALLWLGATRCSADAPPRLADARLAGCLSGLDAGTHPRSARAFERLGEACLAAGDRAGAVAAYEQALRLDPRSRAARYELARLAGRPLAPFPFLVSVHIVAGVLSLAAGAMAMAARKGGLVHRAAGKAFMVAMLAMAGSAVVRAAQQMETEVLNFWMGMLALYLVTSGWRAARRHLTAVTLLDRTLPAVAGAVAAGLLAMGLGDGEYAGPALVFAVVAALAAIGDLRWQRDPSPDHTRRLLRHLWRVGLAMFIAVSSLFLGQPQVFPYAVRSSGALFAPTLVVIGAFSFWFFRYRFGRRPGRQGLHPDAGRPVGRST